jgi:disulfide bond formation protein DsbB
MNDLPPQNAWNADDAVDPGHAAPVAREHADPYRVRAIGAGVMLTLTLPAILSLMAVVMPEQPRDPVVVWAKALGVAPTVIYEGRSVYTNSCALCHGQDAQGIARLGKPLRNSSFVQEHTDEDLLSLIATGRLPDDPLNTTGAVMPARGAKSLSDMEMASVVFYLRTLQDSDAKPASLDDWIVATTAGAGGEQVAGIVGQAGGIGHQVFVASCSACHGPQGQGLEGLGKPLAGSNFVESKTDEELAVFIKSGRPIWDAENTTGLDMPPKGGNPALSDEQIQTIIKYIRTLHPSGAGN